MYDAIVVGAGPAGSSAARALAAGGHRVLLTEKYGMPRNKSCSGILIQKSIALIGEYFGETVPESVMCAPHDSRGMVFTDDAGREFRYEQAGLNIRRDAFDHWLARMAVGAGAELRDGTAAVRCEEQDDSVLVSLCGDGAYDERARVVIVCDGAVGSLRRKVVRSEPKNIITYQTFNRGRVELDPHYFYAYLNPALSDYDAWCNVKDEHLIFGVSVKDAHRIEPCYAAFMEYMRVNHGAAIERTERTERWIMPHIQPGCPVDRGRGRIFFTGETAGFLNPMGEGISAALESGYAVAAALCEAGLGGAEDLQAAHDGYRMRSEALGSYMRRQWRFVGSMAKTFAHMCIPTSENAPVRADVGIATCDRMHTHVP